ncbi:uncharacterized protein EDB93DRAFT_1140882 [Suillus bovinus]|uniref:uncharacterized protein n=1 Tax=Suillus bovinus TaxID=48563 RepID=UPI001B879D3A|nr:uncharacterized protein EDB93DRAFT_1140882 [Suillus bovinus]KAG2151078.1 hypothetical protein EDB93DRAFT_1140882 [Suillus bovinus]
MHLARNRCYPPCSCVHIQCLHCHMFLPKMQSIYWMRGQLSVLSILAMKTNLCIPLLTMCVLRISARSSSRFEIWTFSSHDMLPALKRTCQFAVIIQDIRVSPKPFCLSPASSITGDRCSMTVKTSPWGTLDTVGSPKSKSSIHLKAIASSASTLRSIQMLVVDSELKTVASATFEWIYLFMVNCTQRHRG